MGGGGFSIAGASSGWSPVEANPQQENNFVFLSPFHSIMVIYTPSMLSERVSVSSCSEKETMCFVTR